MEDPYERFVEGGACLGRGVLTPVAPKAEQVEAWRCAHCDAEVEGGGGELQPHEFRHGGSPTEKDAQMSKLMLQKRGRTKFY